MPQMRAIAVLNALHCAYAFTYAFSFFLVFFQKVHLPHVCRCWCTRPVVLVFVPPTQCRPNAFVSALLSLSVSPCNSFLFLFDVARVCACAFIECQHLCMAKKVKCGTSLAPLLLRRHSPGVRLCYSSFLRFFYTLVATPGIAARFAHSTVFRFTSTTFALLHVARS